MEKKNSISINFYTIFSNLMQGLCLFMLLLGMEGTIIELLDLPNEPDVGFRLVLILILLCAWSFLIHQKGRLRLLGALAGTVLMAYFLWKIWDCLDGGTKIIGNYVIDLINNYYDTDFVKWYQAETAQEAQAAFQLSFIILGALTGILFYAGEKGKWGILLKGIIPVLIVLFGLLVGKAPSECDLFFIMCGVMLGQLFQGRSGVLPVAGSGVIIGAAFLFAYSPMAEKILNYHDGWSDRQLQLEDKMLEIADRIDALLVFTRPVQSSYTATNEAPNQTGKQIFKITLEECPTELLYIKGFVGGEYQNGTWQAVSRQELSEQAQKFGMKPEAYIAQIVNLSYDTLTEQKEKMTSQEESILSIETDEGYIYIPYASVPALEEVTIEMLQSQSGYALCPYYTQIPEEQIPRADGSLSPQKQNVFQWQSYLTLPGNITASGFTHSEKEEIWKNYTAYVEEQYTKLPEESLDGLKTFAEENEDAYVEQIIFSSSYYDYDNLNFGVQKVRDLLWDNAYYSFDLEPVPAGEDYAEYFLLEQHKGYCVHFATAGTLLCRIYGVPARFVSGYVVSPSDFTRNKDGTYTAVVTDKRAHAWTEVYQESIGFYPVEMTPPSYTELLTSHDENLDIQEEVAQMDEQMSQELEEHQQAMEQQANQEEAGQELMEQQESEQQKNETQNSERTEMGEEELPQQKEAGSLNPGQGTEDGTGSNTDNTAGMAERIKAFLYQYRKYFQILGIFMAVAAAFYGLVSFLRWRRSHILQKRAQMFEQEDSSQAAFAIGKELFRLLRKMGFIQKKEMSDLEYGVFLQKELELAADANWSSIMEILQKAVFSEEKISEEEREELLVLYRELSEQYQKGKNRIWVLYLKYILIYP